MIDPNKLTEKSQEALDAAQPKPRDEGLAQLDVEHLAAALVDQAGGIVPSVLTALGIQPAQLSTALATELQRQPKVSGNVQLSASARLGRVLQQAQKEAQSLGLVKREVMDEDIDGESDNDEARQEIRGRRRG